LSLSLPREFSAITTSSELLQAVKEKHLWVARTGSCHVNISFFGYGFEDGSSGRLRGEELHELKNMVRGLEVCFLFANLRTLELLLADTYPALIDLATAGYFTARLS
jgi:hypothetical protein